MDTSFGSVLRELRRKANVTQRGLAEQIGVDFSYISKLENDRLPPPSADTAVAICQVLNTPPEQLLALIGKIPSEVEKALATAPAAQRFLREAQLMRLSDQEWKEMRVTLRRMRERGSK